MKVDQDIIEQALKDGRVLALRQQIRNEEKEVRLNDDK